MFVKKLSSFAKALPKERYSMWYPNQTDVFQQTQKHLRMKDSYVLSYTFLFENDVTSQFFLCSFTPFLKGKIFFLQANTLHLLYRLQLKDSQVHVSMSCELLIYCITFLLFRPRLSLKLWGNILELRLISWQRRPDHHMVCTTEPKCPVFVIWTVSFVLHQWPIDFFRHLCLFLSAHLFDISSLLCRIVISYRVLIITIIKFIIVIFYLSCQSNQTQSFTWLKTTCITEVSKHLHEGALFKSGLSTSR